MQQFSMTETFDKTVLNIDSVFTDVTAGEPTAISVQFQRMGNPLLKRYSSKLMDQDTFASLCKTISGNIINIGSIVKNDRNEPEKKEINDKKKSKPTKAELIIASNEKAKKEKELQGYIIFMKSHQKELLECDNLTITSLAGILNVYKTAVSNKIMKLIILKSLITKYKSSGNELFISFMFEFMMELNYLKDEWQMPEAVIVSEAAVMPSPAPRMSSRAMRQQVARQTAIVSDFDLPTVEELSSETFSENIIGYRYRLE